MRNLKENKSLATYLSKYETSLGEEDFYILRKYETSPFGEEDFYILPKYETSPFGSKANSLREESFDWYNLGRRKILRRFKFEISNCQFL